MLTGIRSTGIPHLGNILSVIIPSINMSNNKKVNSSFIFIADLHSLIDENNTKNSVYQIISTWLSFGLNINYCLFYRQSDIASEVTELAWYFSCFFSYRRLKLSHSFKERIYNKKNEKINVGLFIYPILMAADILLFDGSIIPIGKDQIQHIEIARRIAKIFNKKINNKIFTIPNAFLKEKYSYIIGIDGNKMSKSKRNYINIFSSKEELKKQILKIRTDSKSLNDKKNPNNNSIISIYRLIAPYNKVKEMEKKYKLGGYGYLESKMELYNYIMKKFSEERNKFIYYMNNKKLLDDILFFGAKKAKIIAKKKLNFIRKNLNFNSLIL